MAEWQYRDTNRAKATATIKARYGENVFSEMARVSGKQHRPQTRPFKKGSQLASEAGRLGAMRRWNKYGSKNDNKD